MVRDPLTMDNRCHIGLGYFGYLLRAEGLSLINTYLTHLGWCLGIRHPWGPDAPVRTRAPWGTGGSDDICPNCTRHQALSTGKFVRIRIRPSPRIVGGPTLVRSPVLGARGWQEQQQWTLCLSCGLPRASRKSDRATCDHRVAHKPRGSTAVFGTSVCGGPGGRLTGHRRLRC